MSEPSGPVHYLLRKRNQYSQPAVRKYRRASLPARLLEASAPSVERLEARVIITGTGFSNVTSVKFAKWDYRSSRSTVIPRLRLPCPQER